MLTYMIGAYAFSLVRSVACATAGELALGGFFAAAMATTRVVDVVCLVGFRCSTPPSSADTPWAARLEAIRF